MREKYESLALTDLKAIAKSRGIKGTSTMKKAEVVEAMLKMDSQESQKAVAEGAAVQGEESGRPVGAERPAQAEKAERTEQPEKQAEKPERAEKQTERAERSERQAFFRRGKKYA